MRRRRRQGQSEEDDREGAASGSGDDAVELPIEPALDLHTFHPRDIPEVVEEYLWEASRRGLQEVRLIHGKGTGYQRDVVRKVLDRHPAVEEHATAPGDRGHWGATVAKLRRNVERRNSS
ncbi:MAG: DNA mismatch repair protein MutS [Candidatus Eisenbacteria bacterium]|nr:DNA mismatch repair protein MutS [Candidatus Eisenbacteria bacterium]